jgi:antitoxin Phd
MSALTYRNRQGELVDVPSVTASELKTDFGTILERAMVGGAVAITKHGQHKAVLISQAEFDALTKARSASLDELTKEFDDALLRRMQTPAARKGMAAAFNATSAQLGNAAVRASAKRR